jgi:hypothetical protein
MDKLSSPSKMLTRKGATRGLKAIRAKFADAAFMAPAKHAIGDNAQSSFGDNAQSSFGDSAQILPSEEDRLKHMYALAEELSSVRLQDKRVNSLATAPDSVRRDLGTAENENIPTCVDRDLLDLQSMSCAERNTMHLMQCGLDELIYFGMLTSHRSAGNATRVSLAKGQ